MGAREHEEQQSGHARESRAQRIFPRSACLRNGGKRAREKGYVRANSKEIKDTSLSDVTYEIVDLTAIVLFREAFEGAFER